MKPPSSKSIQDLIDSIDSYLVAHPFANLGEVRAGIKRVAGSASREVQSAAPKCGYLDQAIAAIDGEPTLQSAIRAAAPSLRWITYDSYPPSDIGPYFPAAHAFASIIGAQGPVVMEDFDLGLFLIAPRTNYRDHHHAAPELYAPLTGPHRWRFGVDDAWQSKPAHQPVWNEPWQVHATLTGEVPFLCVFCWTRDVKRAAKVVYAPDWDVIEAGP